MLGLLCRDNVEGNVTTLKHGLFSPILSRTRENKTHARLQGEVRATPPTIARAIARPAGPVAG